jgi:class 3 adenylate cyclase
MSSVHHERYLRELRLFLEELCCTLVRFRHAAEDHVPPEDVKITQESSLGAANGFADIRVAVNGQAPYFIEVDYAYPRTEVVASMTRKYGPAAQLGGATKVIILLDAANHDAWPALRPLIEPNVHEGLQLDVWDENNLLSMFQQYFGIKIDRIGEEHVLSMRAAMDAAKGAYAFEEAWVGDAMQRVLIWHFGFWRLKHLRASTPGSAIIPPGLYKDVAVVMADMCSFCSYMRETRREEVIRDCLTTFYSKARYEILNTGGMLYQFVGDEVIGLYGIPDQREGYLDDALDCAKALIDIGNAVSGKWQRQIDTIQTARGLHIGIAIGDMQIVSLQPFGRTHLGGLGEVINIAARLLSQAGPSELIASNMFYEALGQERQAAFQRCEPLEARHMGLLQAWKMTFPTEALGQEASRDGTTNNDRARTAHAQ